MKVVTAIFGFILAGFLTAQFHPVEASHHICTNPSTGAQLTCLTSQNCIAAGSTIRCVTPGAVSGPTSTIQSIFGQIVPPDPVAAIGRGGEGIGNLLSRLIELLYIVAGIVFVVMILIGAFQWIVSGGDKDALSKARSRVVHAIAGITLLALAFVIIKLVGQITGFEFFAGQNRAPQVVYEGGDCRGDESWWVKIYDNGEEEFITNHGRVPGQCGNPEEEEEAPASQPNSQNNQNPGSGRNSSRRGPI